MNHVFLASAPSSRVVLCFLCLVSASAACAGSAPAEGDDTSSAATMSTGPAASSATATVTPATTSSATARMAAGAAGAAAAAATSTAGVGTRDQGAQAGLPATAGVGAATGTMQPTATAGAPTATATGAAGASGSGATTAAVASVAGASGGMQGATGQAGAGAAGTGGAEDPIAFAAGLSELFIDAPCDSATRAPLAQGATCNHPPNTQHIEKMVSFGGDPAAQYTVTLRVRGIWEPTDVAGGERPDPDAPFTVGGQVAAGAGSSSDAINYQQYYIEVAEPKQTYWLNDYQYVAHDIHKEDYEANLTVAGGSQIKVVMNDGNEREIANFTQDMFSDVPPYDEKPSLGQSLRLDVIKVEPAP